METKKLLAQREEDLHIQEKKIIAELETADELINDATSKLHEALSSSSFNKQAAQVAYMMMDTGKAKRDEAKKKLSEIREKQRTLEMKTHKLLDKVLPLKNPQKELNIPKKRSSVKDGSVQAKKQRSK